MCYTIFLRDTRSCIDSHIPHGYPGYTCGVWGVKLKQLWGGPRGICALKCVNLEEPLFKSHHSEREQCATSLSDTGAGNNGGTPEHGTVTGTAAHAVRQL